jgi:hypothetical protein
MKMEIQSLKVLILHLGTVITLQKQDEEKKQRDRVRKPKTNQRNRESLRVTTRLDINCLEWTKPHQERRTRAVIY